MENKKGKDMKKLRPNFCPFTLCYCDSIDSKGKLVCRNRYGLIDCKKCCFECSGCSFSLENKITPILLIAWKEILKSKDIIEHIPQQPE